MRKIHLIGFVLALLSMGACSTEQMVGTGAGAAGGYALGGGKGAAAGAIGGGILGTDPRLRTASKRLWIGAANAAPIQPQSRKRAL